MTLSAAYLQTTKNLDSVLNSIVNAKAPDRFTYKFLEDLGFKSSNDRLYIAVFKALGFLDDNSAPTQLYLKLIDQTETGKVLAEGIQNAYEDLFALRKDAYNLSLDEIKGKMKTLTEGKKSDNVINYMANTFLALCERADWSVLDDTTSIDNASKDAHTSLKPLLLKLTRLICLDAGVDHPSPQASITIFKFTYQKQPTWPCTMQYSRAWLNIWKCK